MTVPQTTPFAHGPPPTRDTGILLFGVLCASSAPPLMAAIAAPALAIAFWRNALALVVLVPWAALRSRREIATLRGRRLLLIAFAAVMLATHFGSMAASLDHTSVASAAALVCTQAVWAALFSRILGERLTLVAWLGTFVALAGVLLVTGIDAAVSTEAVLGNLLAILAGAAGGAYIVAGGIVRQSVGVTAYTTTCYGICAATLLGAALLAGAPLWGFPPRAWIQLAALTVLAQLLGHSIFNLVVRSVRPSFVSLTQLLTVPLAVIAAAIAFGESPPPAAYPALVLMLVGTGMVVSAARRRPLQIDEL
ncbi:DMT family transporter [Mumia sp. Pv 4-285]|uniref:DMT family transporter n=1 Tax=Mumia qirimensis TaxID=3234852 RepID=UPI00351D5FAD